jgi:hypothetical protein
MQRAFERLDSKIQDAMTAVKTAAVTVRTAYKDTDSQNNPHSRIHAHLRRADELMHGEVATELEKAFEIIVAIRYAEETGGEPASLRRCKCGK